MARASIKPLIINSPYEEPGEYWEYERESRSFLRKQGRRPAGYVIASKDSQSFDDPGHFIEIPLVNRIRECVREWRAAGYPGVTGITRRLLEHWTNPERFSDKRFFFCQLEAAETLIWLAEAPAAAKTGIEIPSDGGSFDRFCAKMATGTGKTVVMAMVIAWQILNKLDRPQDRRFSKNVLVIAPGITVRERLAVLKPSRSDNYYRDFDIVPSSEWLTRLSHGEVLVRNWHALSYETKEQIAKKRSVDKRGAKSDAAYVREVLQGMENAHNLLVINDEAHHAWRVPAGGKMEGATKEETEEAAKWVGGLDRIARERGILRCYDFSATPFVPSGRRSSEEALFDWIVSDFGLSDAIEAGLVKTPHVAVRDDALPEAKEYRSRLYHIYNDPEVRDDLNRKAKPEEPLPDLVMRGYDLLGYDWRKTAEEWAKREGSETPPVMITVTNRTETAARVRHAFARKKVRIEELCDPKGILHIDSKALAKAESAEGESEAQSGAQENDADENGARAPRKLSAKDHARLLREQVDTVGRRGEKGEQIRNVISVGMLSEGWDAKTVTHIMGLRAFSSQLLCEQVVGRGLRRTSYEVNPETGLFSAEYVNIFGVPFTFLPHEGGKDDPPPPPTPKTAVHPREDGGQFEIRWPNVLRIDRNHRPRLSLDLERVEPLVLKAGNTPQLVELAPTIEGKQDFEALTAIDLKGLAQEYRLQRIIFETARDVYEQMAPNWRGGKVALMAQLVRLVEQFLRAAKIRITPASYQKDALRRRLVIMFNMGAVVRHIWGAIDAENTESRELVLDRDRPICSTGDMRTWYTGKPCGRTERSHINFCVCDSTWESSDAFALDHAPEVAAWVKNDHLGFEVLYMYRGAVRKYRPDFLVRLQSGDMLILETKGAESEQDRIKHRFLSEWVDAVNAHGGFGRWRWDVSREPGEIRDILARHSCTDAA